MLKICNNKSCDKLTKNPKFCSKTCATKFNNKQFPKRKLKKKTCKKCKKLLNRSSWKDRNTVCDNCNKNKVDWSKIKYKDLKQKRNYQKNSRIRDLARKIYHSSDKPKKCINCNYEKHFDVCHVKGISTFSEDSFISEINDLNNLIALCKNCHWEFDNGLLKLSCYHH